MNESPPPATSSGPNPDPVPSSTTNTRGRSTQNRRRGGTNNINPSNPTTFEGSCSALGRVLGMRVERFQRKLPFHQFTEKVYFYIVAEYKDGSDLYPLFKHFEDPMDALANEMPVKPEVFEDTNPSIVEAEKEVFKEEIKQFVQRKLTLRRNMQKAFGLIWGQCSNQLQEYMKGLSEYEDNSSIADVIWLLEELKKATAGFDSKGNPRMNMQDAVAALYRMRQGPHESNEHYMDRFKSNITAIELT